MATLDMSIAPPEHAASPAAGLGAGAQRVLSATFQPRRGRHLRAALLLLAPLLAVVAWYWQPITAYGATGSAYAARMGCSCRFVAGRDLDDCQRDFEPGMSIVTMSEDAGARSVTARTALLFPQTATWRQGEGCTLEPWRD